MLQQQIKRASKPMKPMSFTITLAQHKRQNNTELEVGEQQNLSEGASFWNLETDLKPIYQNFNLLSYFSPSLQISLQRAYKNPSKNNLTSYEFLYNQGYVLTTLNELEKDDYRAIYEHQGEKLRIKYCIYSQKYQGQEMESINIPPKIPIIDVEFTVEEPVQGSIERNIVINIVDVDGWILTNLYPIYHEKRTKFGRVSERRKSTRRRNRKSGEPEEALANGLIELPARLRLPEYNTDLEYFYLEPKNERHKNIRQKHIALALQGGGCKGVAYIGAYKAILDNYKNEEIKSIIGSSAGGIIGLAVCCKISPEGIIDLCQNYLSKVTEDKTYPQSNQQTQKMVKRYLKILQEVLRQYNIFDGQIIDIVKEFLSDKQFTDYLFELFKSGAGLTENQALLGLFKYDNGEKNLCGLLNGKLMTGAKIQDIARACLEKMEGGKKFNEGMQRYLNSLNEQDRKDWKNKMTMKQLYEITDIEFTCTSVDITNHILRFFNHKTTPNLPVVNAVQMTGAFPVAFQATYWKKQWGKYYIHYENMRREVDLQGCKFTDGGMLANFPIDCIDNDDMRPMYFSHVKDENTIMFGVGLSECAQPNQKQKQAPINPLGWRKIFSKIGLMRAPSLAKQYFEGRSSKFAKIMNFLNKSQVKELDITDKNLFSKIKQIPLFDFGFNLLLTYTTSKDKLAEQSFKHQSFQVSASETIKSYLIDREQASNAIQTEIDKLKLELENLLNDPTSELEVLISNLKYLASKPTPKTQFELLKIHNKLDAILTKLILNFRSAFGQEKDDEIKLLMYERVEESYKKSQSIKPVEGELTALQILTSSLDHKASMKIPKKQLYQEILLTNLKRYFFNRVLFELEFMKNCKLFYMCNIKKDYEIMKKIANETIIIINQIFDKNNDSKLSVKIREKFKEDNVFLPGEFLKCERQDERKKIEDLVKKLQYPNKYRNLKKMLQEATKMLNLKIQYNKKSMKLFKSDPYDKNLMLKLITEIFELYELRDFSFSLNKLVDQTDSNEEAHLTLDIIRQTQYSLNKIIHRTVFQKNSIATDFLEIQECLITCRIQNIKSINQLISSMKSCVELVIAYENYSKRQNISSYIKKVVELTENKFDGRYQGFHLVLESAPLCELYLLNFLEIMKGFNVEMKCSNPNSQYNKPVTSITSSNFHSIAAILYTSDLPVEKMEKYANEIKDLSYENQGTFIQRIQRRIASGQWAKKLPVLLRDLTSLYTEQSAKKNIFAEMEQRLSRTSKWEEFKNQMISIQQNAENYKERVSQLIEQSLNCVLDEIYNTDSSNIQDKLDKVADSLALKFKQKTQEEQTNIQAFLELTQQLSLKYIEVLKVAAQSSEYVAEELVLNISMGQKKDAWKGLILGEIHTSYKIKALVQRILEEVGLTRNTTLQQFYNASCRKITLNFTVINTQSNCVQIYNHFTRPRMPVWAAVVASSSLIQFFKPLSDKKQWSYHLLNNSQERIIKKYFKEPGPSTHHLYSADSLRKLPVDLLTNRKMSEIVYRKKQSENISQGNFDSADRKNLKEIFLIFDFQVGIEYSRALKNSQKNSENKNILKIENINFKDIIKFSRMNVKGETVFNTPFVSGNFKRLSLYIDSHDKLITHLYKKQLIQLPIRLGTVDFQRMCDQNTKKLSLISNDSVMQSYYAMSQKIMNYKALQNELDNPIKILYFRIECEDQIPNTKLRIRFLSKLVPNKSFKEDYKIYYKQNPQSDFIKIDDEFIHLSTIESLYLKIQFVEIRTQVQQSAYSVAKSGKTFLKLQTNYFKLDLSQFKIVEKVFERYGFVYSLAYTKSKDQFLTPHGGFHEHYDDDYYLVRRKFFRKTSSLPSNTMMEENFEMQRTSSHNISKEINLLTIPVTLESDLIATRYQKPVCDKYHILTLKYTEDEIPIFKNSQIKLKIKVPTYWCQTCFDRKQQKFKYTMKQKYHIKLSEGMVIKCTHDNHTLGLRARLHSYPLSIELARCNRCDQDSTLSYFRDDGCNVNVCFTCVFQMIKGQL